MNGAFFEWLKIVAPIASAIVTVLLTYRFTLQGKTKDFELQKRAELNSVLSSLLEVWDYLNKLNNILQLRNSEDFTYPIPKHFLPTFLLQSNAFDDECFARLDASVSQLKRYDPVAFYRLEGWGRRLGFVKSNFLAPFLMSNKNDDLQSITPNRQFHQVVEATVENMRYVAGLLGRKTLKALNNTLDKNSTFDVKELNAELLQEVYQFLGGHVPGTSFDEFVEAMNNPELRKHCHDSIEAMMSAGSPEQLLNLVMANPNITADELQQRLSGNPTQ